MPAVPIGTSRFWRAMETIGVWQTRLLMAIIYLLILGPVAIVLKLAGKDPLQGSALEPGSSFCAPRARPDMKDYLRRLY